MVFRSVAIASMLSGLFATNADAGCFGNRSNQCQSAPVVCNPCTPLVCAPQCVPQVQPFVPTQDNVGHAGPAFPGRSPNAPLGFDVDGARITSVGPLSSVVANVVSPDALQSFIRDLLQDKLRGTPPLNKKQILEATTIAEPTLDKLLEPYGL